jgi:threonine aldolase
MALKLYEAVRGVPGVEITQKVQSNAVFARITPHIISVLQKQYFFYVWDEETSEVRWMCSFDTTEEDIEGFATLLKSLLSD